MTCGCPRWTLRQAEQGDPPRQGPRSPGAPWAIGVAWKYFACSVMLLQEALHSQKQLSFRISRNREAERAPDASPCPGTGPRRPLSSEPPAPGTWACPAPACSGLELCWAQLLSCLDLGSSPGAPGTLASGQICNIMTTADVVCPTEDVCVCQRIQSCK